MSSIGYVVFVWLLVAGLYGIVTSRNLIHAVGCLTVVQSSSYLLLLCIGYREGAAAPFFSDIPATTPVVDPVVQALMLTDVVVSVTVVALLLAIAVQIFKHHGTLDPDALSQLRG